MNDFDKLSVFDRLMKVSGGREVQLWYKPRDLYAFVFVCNGKVIAEPEGRSAQYVSMKQLETRYLSGKKHKRFKTKDYDDLFVLSDACTYLPFRDFLKKPMSTTEVNGFVMQASAAKKRKVQVVWDPLVTFLANKYRVKTAPSAWQFVFQHLENLGCSVEEIGQLYLRYFENNASAAHSLDLARPEQ